MNTLKYYGKPTVSPYRATVVGEFEEKTGELKIAVSLCNPKDQFNKKKGTAIAEGRMRKGKLFTIIEGLNTCSIPQFVAIARDIAQEVADQHITVYPLEEIEDNVANYMVYFTEG